MVLGACSFFFFILCGISHPFIVNVTGVLSEAGSSVRYEMLLGACSKGDKFILCGPS